MQGAQDELISSFLNPDLFEGGDFSSPLSVSSPFLEPAEVPDFFSQATPPSDSPVDHPSSPAQTFLLPTPSPSSLPQPLLPSPLPPTLPSLLPHSPPSSPPRVKQSLGPPSKLPLFPSCAQQQKSLNVLPKPASAPLRPKEEKDASLPNSKKRKTSSQPETSFPSHPVPVAPNPASLPQSPNPPPFSPGAPETELSKRQRQLIKNREAAFLSRQRRKHHMQELETKVAILQKENEELKLKVEALEAKNQELSSRIQLGQKPGMKTAGVVIFTMLFTFVFFLRPTAISPSPATLSSLKELSLPSRTLQAIKEIKEIKEIGQGLEHPHQLLSSGAPSIPSDPLAEGEEEEVEEEEEPKALLEGKLFHNESSLLQLLPFDDDMEESHTVVETIDLEYWINQSLGTPIPSPSALSLSQRILHPPHSKPDVAYLFCSDVRHMLLPNEKARGEKPKLSFLVPSSAGEPDHIVQIDCEVTGIHTLPLPKKVPAGMLDHGQEKNATLLA